MMFRGIDRMPEKTSARVRRRFPELYSAPLQRLTVAENIRLARAHSLA